MSLWLAPVETYLIADTTEALIRAALKMVRHALSINRRERGGASMET